MPVTIKEKSREETLEKSEDRVSERLILIERLRQKEKERRLERVDITLPKRIDVPIKSLEPNIPFQAGGKIHSNIGNNLNYNSVSRSTSPMEIDSFKPQRYGFNNSTVIRSNDNPISNTRMKNSNNNFKNSDYNLRNSDEMRRSLNSFTSSRSLSPSRENRNLNVSNNNYNDSDNRNIVKVDDRKVQSSSHEAENIDDMTDINSHYEDNVSPSNPKKSTTTRSTSPIDDRIIRLVLGDTRDLNNDLNSITINNKNSNFPKNQDFDTQTRTPGRVPVEDQGQQPIENMMSSMAKMMEAVGNLVSNNNIKDRNKSYNSSKKIFKTPSNSVLINTTNKKNIKSGNKGDNVNQNITNNEDIILQNEIQSIRKTLMKEHPTSVSNNEININKKINFDDSNNNVDNSINNNDTSKGEIKEKTNKKNYPAKPSMSEIMDLILSKIQVSFFTLIFF